MRLLSDKLQGDLINLRDRRSSKLKYLRGVYQTTTSPFLWFIHFVPQLIFSFKKYIHKSTHLLLHTILGHYQFQEIHVFTIDYNRIKQANI